MVTLTPRVGIYGPSGARFIQPRSPSRHSGKSGRSAISQPAVASNGVGPANCADRRIWLDGAAWWRPTIRTNSGSLRRHRPSSAPPTLSGRPKRLGGPHVQQRPRLLARSPQGPSQTRPRLWEESSRSQSSTPRPRRRSASVTRSSPSCTSFNGWSYLSSSGPKEGTWIARHGDSSHDVPNGQRAHVQ